MKSFIKIILLALVVCQIFCGACNSAELPPTQQWVKTWDSGLGTDEGFGAAIFTDSKGNDYYYITGYMTGAVDLDGITIKYNSSGDTIWQRSFDALGGIGADRLNGIVLDGNENVYVTGTSDSSAGHKDIVMVKYDSSGNTLVKFYDLQNNNASGYGITLDGSGNIYLVGDATVPTAIATLKCNGSGDITWCETYAANSAEGKAVVVDGSGNVYITGYYTNGIDYCITVKYNSSGNTVWERVYNDGVSDRSNGIALDGAGNNIYITGSSGNDILTIKYNSNSETLWLRKYSGSGACTGNSIKVDSNGYVYVAGVYRNALGNDDFIVIKYTSSGDTLWVITYDNAGGSEMAKAIALNDEGDICVTGTGSGNIVTVKYKQNPVPGMAEPSYKGSVKIGSTGGKGIVYPGDEAIIAFKPTEPGQVIVRIYTLNGLLVYEFPPKTVTNIEDDANNIIQWACSNSSGAKVASGVYLVYVEGPGIKVTKKLAILR